MGNKSNEQCEPISVKVTVAAKMLGVGPRTVRKMIERGDIPSVVPDVGPMLIPVCDLKDYVNKNKKYCCMDGIEIMAAKMLMSMRGEL